MQILLPRCVVDLKLSDKAFGVWWEELSRRNVGTEQYCASKSSEVNMKSMGQLCLMRLVGLANCEKRKFCYPSTPTHFLISTELDNTFCKRSLISLPLAGNSMYSTPGTELCKAYGDMPCSRNCLTTPTRPRLTAAWQWLSLLWSPDVCPEKLKEKQEGAQISCFAERETMWEDFEMIVVSLWGGKGSLK